MVYLKPVGGLCNRIRAIDSIISLCIKYNQDLTVLWVNSNELRCDFKDLFKPITTKTIKVTIAYNLSIEDFLKKHNIKSENFLKSEFWFKLYDSKNHVANGLSQNKVDKIFYKTIERKMNSLFNNNDNFLVETFYRHSNINDNSYTFFTPIDNIHEKVAKKIKEFNCTIGLHIRRTDHMRAKKVSTNDKIYSLIHRTLKDKPDTTFFISSDCYSTKQALLSKFKKNIITNQNVTYERNKKSGIQDAVLDLYCLASTQKIYGSYFSSYSQVASDINKIENVIIK